MSKSLLNDTHAPTTLYGQHDQQLLLMSVSALAPQSETLYIVISLVPRLGTRLHCHVSAVLKLSQVNLGVLKGYFNGQQISEQTSANQEPMQSESDLS